MHIANRLKEVQEYYFSAKLREIRALEKEGKDVINLGIGSPDLLPPGRVIEKLKIENERIKSDLVEPEKNWAELNPDFDVPHRGYE